MDDFKTTLQEFLKRYNFHFTNSDDDVPKSLTRQIGKRDQLYTELLKNHIDITKVRGKAKEFHKWVFFWLIIVASVCGIVFIGRIFNKILSEESIDVVLDAIPIIITALISFVSTIIVVPATIAKFLFNAKEDDNITLLIQHTQEHDATGMSLFKDKWLTQKNPKDKFPTTSLHNDD